MNDSKIAFPNMHRQTSFFDLQIPMMEDVPLNATFDSYAVSANFVPHKYENGDFIFSTFDKELEDKKAHDLVFTIAGDKEIVTEALDKIVQYVQDVYSKLIAPNEYHVAYRTLYSDNPEHKECARLLLVRIYRNEDFVCTEHPEMLVGAPIGMYHCPGCGDMQLAGVPHLPKESEYSEV